ncbi:unnamed protein product [Fraxinus pennsylvanica]|uniref:histidine kinase n=1 Tax=Fraxinus pennsylvanica TaxID=56036 RepID=A0AAD2A424_9LAMI|nr:unnamed protein product [Fraxinus pennsylvanica]
MIRPTGKGIPKEKQKSVFENYVQVKETALGQEGTGLGLVRLMGGEIGIVDKQVGERGTCFRFNTFFSTCTEIGMSGNARDDDIEVPGGSTSSGSYQYSGSINRSHSPKAEVSQLVIFIQSNERAKIIQKFMVRQGIKVYAVKQHEQLSDTLKRIKQKLNLSRQSSSVKSEVNTSRASSTRSKDVPLSSLEGTDNVPSLQRRTSARSFSSLVLIVIDTSAGPFRDISRAVAEFRRDPSNNYCSRVVWLNKPGTNSINFHGLDEAAANKTYTRQIVGKSSSENTPSRKDEIEELSPEFAERRGENLFNPKNIVPGQIHHESHTSGTANTSHNQDDDPIGRKIATSSASQLGAYTFSCVMGNKLLKQFTGIFRINT